MVECYTRTEALRAGTPVTVGSVTLLPIERVVLHSNRSGTGAWLSGTKEVLALIVRDAFSIGAVDGNGMAVALEALREKVQGLDAALAALSAR